MVVAAGGVLGGLATRLRWPMTDLSRLDLALAGDPGPDPADLGDDPTAGQVLVSVEYVVDAGEVDGFLRLAGMLEPARRRTGASRWDLFQDTDRPQVFVEQFLVRSWQAHLRQHRLATAADRALEERVWRFHRSDGAPPARHLLKVDDAGDPPLRLGHAEDGSD